MRHNGALMSDKTDKDAVFTCSSKNNNNNHSQPIKYALERKLQQRTPREQLIDQGIMPALATAPSLLSQKTKLERAKTGDYLQKKIRVRPNRAQLVQRHILNDVSQAIDPSLLANQMKLKRKKLEDDLNERLAIRPGPLELVKDNILEQGTAVGLAIQEGNIDYTETAKSHLLEPISPESFDGSPEPSPDGNSLITQIPPTSIAEFFNKNASNITLSQGSQPLDGKPYEESQSLKKEGRSRKKSPKPKFKKYKYHEYRPPNGELQKSNLPMDSPYALMLQQQQLYLQLQVLYQNYPQFVSLPSIPENTAKISNNNNNVDDEKPVKIEDMRVVDMRKELKMRGLPVSGSKTDLIERLKASLSFSGDQGVNSTENLSNDSMESNQGSLVSSISSGSPIPVSSVTTIVNGHTKLGRSNSLPAHEARLQQVQMQLMANCKKLQTQLPPEVQQQLQHLQYLNLQTHLQQLRVQPHTNIQPKPIQFNVQTSSSQQPVSVANQHQQVSTMAPIKKELNVTDSCVFSQQQIQQSSGQVFTHSTTTSDAQAPFFSHPLSTNLPSPVITMTQATPSLITNSANLEQQKHMQNFSPAQSQGLLHLKAEANKLNIAASHSEPDLSHMDKLDFSGWNQGMKHLTHDNKPISPSHGSPCQTPNMFAPPAHHHQEHKSRPIESVEYNPAREKPDSMQRSYSEHTQEDGGIMMHAVGQDAEKQRSMSEPANPFVHRRSCSLPSGQLFFDHLNPPPSYEAHMAAQMHRKLSQEHIYQPQQHTVPAKTEDMDQGMDAQQDRELTQELQRVMMKQDLGVDNDEILEILGASVGSSVGSPVHSTANKVIISSPPNQLSPQRFGQAPHVQNNSNVSKSPSANFLGVHNSPSNNQQFQRRLSRSCEDVTGLTSYNNPNNVNPKHGMQSSAEGSLADLDSIIMSPASPMRIDSDTDHLMSMSNSIPIPSNYVHKSDTLSWLDLSNSPIMTSPTGAATEVTYMNRASPPPTLYGASPSLHHEQFPLSLFELDATGSNNLSHDFSEAMDFCV
ncbi:myocardin-related transcription factor A-like isoform X2 [Actinia tenebrosa]|nr:myocardin-related transcription factor A-like isoform X2 [Actinia tenebrosa]